MAYGNTLSISGQLNTLVVPAGLTVSSSGGTATIATTLSGLLKGTGSGFTPAAAGTDYGHALSVYSAGTAYSLTATAAALVFGTTSPNLVIDAAGTYLVLAEANLKYNAATFAAVRNATLKLRRTNNTAADLTNISRSIATQIITTLTFGVGVIQLPPAIYTTANADDSLSIFASMDTLPVVGSVDVVDANIVAVRLY